MHELVKRPDQSPAFAKTGAVRGIIQEEFDTTSAMRYAVQCAGDDGKAGIMCHLAKDGEILQPVRPRIRIVVIVRRWAIQAEIDAQPAVGMDRVAYDRIIAGGRTNYRDTVPAIERND